MENIVKSLVQTFFIGLVGVTAFCLLTLEWNHVEIRNGFWMMYLAVWLHWYIVGFAIYGGAFLLGSSIVTSFFNVDIKLKNNARSSEVPEVREDTTGLGGRTRDQVDPPSKTTHIQS